jgi:hypothetical protein
MVIKHTNNYIPRPSQILNFWYENYSYRLATPAPIRIGMTEPFVIVILEAFERNSGTATLASQEVCSGKLKSVNSQMTKDPEILCTYKKMESSGCGSPDFS